MPHEANSKQQQPKPQQPQLQPLALLQEQHGMLCRCCQKRKGIGEAADAAPAWSLRERPRLQARFQQTLLLRAGEESALAEAERAARGLRLGARPPPAYTSLPHPS